jgi:L-asparaginase II
MAVPDDFAPVAITRRSGFDESVHFGAVVALGPSGQIEVAVGNPHTVVYPRSSSKPLQAVAMVRAGLHVHSDQLAIVCASHAGTPEHLAVVRTILAGAGLDEASLANTPDLPLDEHAAEAVLRAGGGRTALQMNCSGKHAGMVATSAASGWATDASYLEVDHPLQQRITDTIDELTEETHRHIGVDGCGAPAHAFTLLGLARAFGTLASGRAGVAGNDVCAAMTAHPYLVGGDGREVTALMRTIPGLMAKDGAEGVFAAALSDGRSVAIKIADGNKRATAPVLLAALRRLGVDTSPADPLVVQQVRGHGDRVGEVRAIAP